MTSGVGVLWVVLPVFNERESIETTVSEWLACLRRECPAFILRVINDGSTDGSLKVLQRLAESNREIRLIDQANKGHGQACLAGYRLSIRHHAEFVLQIDSDGQCDPSDFNRVWKRRNINHSVFGQRKRRRDGLLRTLISKSLTLLVFCYTGVWVRNANVPYRLIPREWLEAAVRLVPGNVVLANVFLSVILQHHGKIQWVTIGFRERHGGQPATRIPGLAAKAIRLGPQLLRFRAVLPPRFCKDIRTKSD